MASDLAIVPVWRDRTSLAAANDPVGDAETADLAIVGGGIFGLSTALAAARSGLSVRVVEARRLGEGASGLNGGQVIPGLKYDPEQLVEHFGTVQGDRITRFATSTANSVFDLIRDEALDVPTARNGWIGASHTPAALEAAIRRARQWQALGADVSPLDRAGVAGLTGTASYLGGWIDRRAGVVHPLAYVLELARVARQAGIRIAEGERVTGLEKAGDGWRVRTARGAAVRARKVLVATNAYSDGLVPGLAASLVWLHSFQIATARLPPALDAAIIPGEQAVSDSRRILVYFRKSHDGRFMLGGRGRMSEPRSAADWAHLERAMVRLYPALSAIPVERRWVGRVSMTPDHLPHIHEPEPGLIAVAGCQGRGIGLMTALGPALAAYAADGDREALPFPVTPIRPIPLHAFRKVGVAAAIAWYRMLDGIGR